MEGADELGAGQRWMTGVEEKNQAGGGTQVSARKGRENRQRWEVENNT